MSDLNLHVKTEYFEAIKRGEKTEEYRLKNRYWESRLLSIDVNPSTGCTRAVWNVQYDHVIIYNAYKPGEDNRIAFPWLGWELKTITHKHFGPEPVTVFAIKLEK